MLFKLCLPCSTTFLPPAGLRLAEGLGYQHHRGVEVPCKELPQSLVQLVVAVVAHEIYGLLHGG